MSNFELKYINLSHPYVKSALRKLRVIETILHSLALEIKNLPHTKLLSSLSSPSLSLRSPLNISDISQELTSLLEKRINQAEYRLLKVSSLLMGLEQIIYRSTPIDRLQFQQNIILVKFNVDSLLLRIISSFSNLVDEISSLHNNINDTLKQNPKDSNLSPSIKDNLSYFTTLTNTITLRRDDFLSYVLEQPPLLDKIRAIKNFMHLMLFPSASSDIKFTSRVLVEAISTSPPSIHMI